MANNQHYVVGLFNNFGMDYAAMSSIYRYNPAQYAHSPTPFPEADIDAVINHIYSNDGNQQIANPTDIQREILKFLLFGNMVLCAEPCNIPLSQFVMTHYTFPVQLEPTAVYALKSEKRPFCRWQVICRIRAGHELTTTAVKDYLQIKPKNCAVVKDSFAVLPVTGGRLFKIEYGVEGTCRCEKPFRDCLTQLTSSLLTRVSEEKLKELFKYCFTPTMVASCPRQEDTSPNHQHQHQLNCVDGSVAPDHTRVDNNNSNRNRLIAHFTGVTLSLVTMAEVKNVQKNDDTVAIKPEYLVEHHEPKLVLDCVSDTDRTKLAGESPNKKQKYSKHNKKILKGQNKGRGPTFRQDRESTLCPKLVDVNESAEELPTCDNEKCTFIHDVNLYLSSKEPDIQEECYVFNTKGHCPRGATCRFGKSHLTSNGRNIKRCDTVENSNSNFLSYDCQHALRKRKYNFRKTEQVMKLYDKRKQATDTAVESKPVDEKVDENAAKSESLNSEVNENAAKSESLDSKVNENAAKSESIDGEVNEQAKNVTEDVAKNRLGFSDDSDLIRLKPDEKKKITWKNKLVLSPLTTVGNLPFRRICKEFGADVTCGEMALASSLLQGLQQEWALVRRHKSEDIFGVQVCGNNPHVMTKCAQLLQEQTDIDFIDVNLGCPIDLVYQQGAGSGLLRSAKVLESILTCMNDVTDIPLTVKTRTGIYKDTNVVHTLMPRFVKSNVSLISIHGRTREQRYTKSADWDYMEECAKLAGDIPVFGNGDILSYEDYNEKMEKYPHISGVLIARGALYKPWLFTEIKEQRHWDISSSERMDIIKKYVNYGLEHWGSDNKGVENTRRFLLEWLSFLHRYIPVGLLEYPPQKINQRPPFYKGRDDLETLFASPNCQDWIKISEMLLGPVPEGFNFLPKHKASSWK